ncbi:MAG TPA: hypothetical protein VLT87_11055 [Thermoanaerobaculia bacterium]|nr:hypothetical protein [Thermoanaerobaculia bacterium]
MSSPVYFWPAAATLSGVQKAVIREIAAIETACHGLEDACAAQGVTYQRAVDAARERAKESTSGLPACIDQVTGEVWGGQWAPDPRPAPQEGR